jgi:hypothetical protein
MERVKLLTAFSWICPECRKRNFVAAVDRELTEDEQKALLDLYGEPEEGSFDLVVAPRVVSCEKCKVKFETYEDADFKE